MKFLRVEPFGPTDSSITIRFYLRTRKGTVICVELPWVKNQNSPLILDSYQ